jgi:general nucleoside transport system permease protein
VSTAWQLDGGVWQLLRRPRTFGFAGILVGLFAGFIAVPPIESRTAVWPILVGIVAVAFGIWTIARGERRLGWGAVAAGVFGIALGILATRSSSGNLDNVFNAGLISGTFVFSTPLIFGGIGGLFSERSGVVNVGLEGMMLMGAFWGVYGADKTGSWVTGVLIAAASGGLMALVHAYFAIHLRADQIVSGMAMNFLALGITGYFHFQLYHGQDVPAGVPTIPRVNLPLVGHLGNFLKTSIGHLNLMVWLSFLLVILTSFVVFKTPIGLRIRACGEHPRAADTVGISVYAIRYGCVTLSGILAALGGAYLSIGFGGGTFNDNMTAGTGFIALAAMIFGNWRPFGTLWAALLFGFSTKVGLLLQTYSQSASTLFRALPYVLTLVAVAGVIGRTVPPAADGKPYVKQ